MSDRATKSHKFLVKRRLLRPPTQREACNQIDEDQVRPAPLRLYLLHFWEEVVHQAADGAERADPEKIVP